MKFGNLELCDALGFLLYHAKVPFVDNCEMVAPPQSPVYLHPESWPVEHVVSQTGLIYRLE